MRASAVLGLAFVLLPTPALARPPAQNAPPSQPIVIGPPLPPATTLEAFRVEPGSILSVAYEELGEVEGVFVEAREMRDPQGGRARGVVVTITPPGPQAEPAFVDAEELSALLKGFDSLLAITVNPSGEFKNFDMRYSTKGELVLTASSTRQRGVVYGVETGRLMKTRRPLNGGEFHQLRTLVEAAQQKLATLRDQR